MIPTYPYSLPPPPPMPIVDLNIVEDQGHDLIFSPTHQPSSSSSSLSCPILFNPQDHAGYSYWESNNLQNDHDHETGKNIIGSSGSWNDPEDHEKGGVEIIRKRGLKLKVWKRSEGSKKEDDENYHQTEDHDSVKWMPSKMRMMRKMMAPSDQKASSSSSSSDMNIPPVLGNSQQIINSEDQNQNHQSTPGTDNSSSSNNSSTQTNSNTHHHHNNITVRVCADCHTTKTPLWRSGPRGPKSLCNACGIRQRKARRAMAAAAAANGSPDLLQVAEKSTVKGNYKFHINTEMKKKSKFERETTHQMRKKHKPDQDHHQQQHQAKAANDNNNSRGRTSSSSIIKKFSFEDFTVSLMSKNLAAASQVFPQDEKEAAILLMALSCNGLLS
ncbi:GATA transcription factor 21 [Prosopis cineraria]|uniref:GATA transcription factor 21 n=1 Tax=Prosopis cineraria TaxID=364024 RepID=UPI0024101193|nr:GATA transcription factor 21 [Prosopis cineraria]